MALGGVPRRIDVGTFNGERFGVMAGVGFDALMIEDASRRMKDRLGRAAYVYTGLKNLKKASVHAEVCAIAIEEGEIPSVAFGSSGVIAVRSEAHATSADIALRHSVGFDQLVVTGGGLELVEVL